MIRALLRRRSSVGCILLIVATALPAALLKTPPLIDVLGHMGRYTLQTGLGASPWSQSFYSFRWQLIGNLGADLIVEALHPILDIPTVTRLVVLLVPLLSATGVLLIAREVHGRITPYAVAALALVYGLPFTWGFLNFSLAMGGALLAVALWLRLGRWRWRAPLFVLVSLLLWLCHTFGWAFLGLLCAAESLARRRTDPLSDRALNVLRDIAPLVAPLIPMLAWRSTATGTGIDGWFDLSQKAGWLISTLRLQWQWVDIACAVLLLLAIVAGATSRSTAVDRRLAYAAAIAFAAFVVLPKQIFGSVFADMRLAPYTVMLALLSLRPKQGPDRVLMGMALAFLGFRLLLTGTVYRDREQALEQQMAALNVIPKHARVAMLVQVPCQAEWALPWFSHIGSLALTRRELFVNDQWANASMNPLQVHFPAAGSYATDDRQLFFPARCGMEPTLTRTLSALPTRVFTHLWVVGAAPAALPRHPELRAVWRRKDAAVFAVDPRVLPAH